MKKIYLLFFLLGTLAVSAQKTVHDANAATREAKNFHAIDIADGVDLYLTQGNDEAVAVSASTDEYRNRIRTEVINGVLKIDFNQEGTWKLNWFGNRKLKAYVSVKTLDKLVASGGSDVVIENELSATRIALTLSGGSDFRGKVVAVELKISASGGSDAYISGKAEQLSINASGGSDVHGFELISNTCSIESSGGSDVRITANKELRASASGGSDVYYKGSASSHTSKSGGGSVKKVE
jgi:hypothetical protein